MFLDTEWFSILNNPALVWWTTLILQQCTLHLPQSSAKLLMVSMDVDNSATPLATATPAWNVVVASARMLKLEAKLQVVLATPGSSNMDK